MIAAVYALLALIWGSTWLAIKVGLVGVPPFLGAGLRFLLSATIVGLVLAARRRPITLTRDDKVCALSLGVLVFWLDYGLVYWAEVYISSGLTAVLFSTMPLMTALLSAFWMRSEILSVRKVAGILVGVAGTALLFWPRERLGVMQALGMLSALTGCLCAAINLVVVKKHGRHSDPFVLNAIGMALGALCLLLMSAALEPWTTVVWSRSNVLAILYLSVFGSVIAFTAFYYLIKRMDATVVSLNTLIIPIVALALGRAFLHETVTPMGVAGIMTILAGVGIAVLPTRAGQARQIVGTLAACVLAVLGAAAQQQPVFRGAGDVVRVFVTVTDRDGRLVTTLTQEAFEVRDEGKRQPITQFDNTPRPIRLIVMLDVSGSMEGNLPLLRAAAAQLFARLRPDDVARVGAFGHEIAISPSFTHDVDALLAALPGAIAPDAPTPLWRAIDQALDGFGGDDDRRAVILVLSDGKDSGLFSFRQRPVSQAEVIDRARREDVMIYAVGMRSRNTRSGPPGIGPGGLQAMMLADMPDPGLARVAEETGGGYTEIRFGQDLGAAFTGVADELHTQYLLGFAISRHDGKVHDINVRLTQGGLKPRARKSYLAPKD